MLGILNPDRGLHRSRSEIVSAGSSPRCLSMSSVPRQTPNGIGGGGGNGGGGGVGGTESPVRTRCRRDSLPGTLSLTEAYNVMSVDVSTFFGFFLFFCGGCVRFFFFLGDDVLSHDC